MNNGFSYTNMRVFGKKTSKMDKEFRLKMETQSTREILKMG